MVKVTILGTAKNVADLIKRLNSDHTVQAEVVAKSIRKNVSNWIKKTDDEHD